MKWFLAKIVYRIICGEGEHTAQFDEQMRLVAASDQTEAIKKAHCLGEKDQYSFYNQNNQLVQWQFVNVSEIFCLTQMIDGAEVYSRIKEVKNDIAYTNFVHQRATFLQEQAINQLQNLI